jgi:hypothetical protein
LLFGMRPMRWLQNWQPSRQPSSSFRIHSQGVSTD